MKKNLKKMISWGSPSLLPKKLVFIDGVTRSGKSMLGPVVSSLTKTYPWQYQTILDSLLPVYKHKSIDHSLLTSMLNHYFNKNIYCLNISREINFRKNDFSSVVYDKDYKKYLNNLKIDDGDQIIEKIKRKNHNLVYQTHDLLSMVGELNKLNLPYKMLYIYRHPIDNIFSFFKRYNPRVNPQHSYNIDDPRLYTMMIKHNQQLLPWYALNQEKKFLKFSFLEKVIFYYLLSIKNSVKSYKKLNKTKKNKVLLIQFDSFAINTSNEINRIKKFLDTKTTSHTKKVLKRNNLPRSIELDERDNKLKIIKNSINTTLFKEVLKIKKKYENSNLFF